MTSLLFEQYTSLWSTPGLVGRKDVLEKIEQAFNDPSPTPRLIFLHGEGGIGKTRLLQESLEMARKDKTCRVAEGLLDFYHIGQHTPIGLVNAFFEILTPPFESFQHYQSAYQRFIRARLVGNAVALEKLRDDAIAQFEQDLKSLTASRRVVLALDTIERVVYGLPDGSEDIPLADAWNWLMERLPGWQNVIIIVAGRNEAQPAIEKMKARQTVIVEEVEIKPFSLDESLHYFDEMAKVLVEEKEYQLAERLKNFPQDFKNTAHRLSKGRPILLSLLVDYLASPVKGDVEVILSEMPQEELSDEDYWRYEEALINRLLEGEQGETLIALGRVPKGADDELLASLLNISDTEACKRRKNILKFSVVKTRSGDKRVFLHDEMYALLQRHVYDSSYDAEKQKASFECIKKYYRTRRNHISHKLNELYAPVEEKGRESLELEELGQVHAQYQTLLTEIMYYYLRHDFGRGFRAYYRFSHEALMARDLLMEMQLQAELLAYLSKPPVPIREKDITVELIRASLNVRELGRTWARDDKQAIDASNEQIKSMEAQWRGQFPVLLALAQVWVAGSYMMRGKEHDYSFAESYLEKAFSLLPNDEIQQPFTSLLYPDTLLWLKKAVLAQAHRVNGYLNRVRGFMSDAVQEYQKAAALFREIDLRIELATTMNDMGFAQAELGDWHDGRANVIVALTLRRELGPRVPVALSLNTLAAIQVREGQYADARENSEHALAIFRALSHKRGIGMALTTLAEALRRYAGSTPPLLSPEVRIGLLRRARDHAREANTYFIEIDEKSRQPEALIELGCACRDWAWWLKHGSQVSDDPARIRRESAESFNKAAELAQTNGLTYSHVDALVNLAWLEFYAQSDEESLDAGHAIGEAILRAEKAFPPEADMVKQPKVWAQKGKLFNLKGHLAHRDFELKRKEEKGKPEKEETKRISPEIKDLLKKIAENYYHALNCSARFAPDYQGIRQAKDGIAERLKRLNASEMRVLCNYIQELSPSNSVIQTFLTNRALWQTG